ncbi:hypothetical protein [Gordonia sp. NB41Y]|uniref:hypothetical protein n=1 Tax=Gordonia sp. NB41Y TaxID=875808 RepID=UPI0002C015A5|nr:hypothetical protein [Gordonia sp. NB41Y]EMP12494.1 hypothetical protein ISGA_1783 [Gordonia sp. NB41Y]WLP91302.1 hypothetical protein Q9K23_03260 [Gordonia sp. NB41Y]
MSDTEIVNLVPTSTGTVRTVCSSCDRLSRPRRANAHGQPHWADWPRGWSEAPYPRDFVHADGSLGSTFTCPRCARLRAERQAAGITPLLEPSPRRIARIAELRRER